uniref:Ubiquinone biosynthesis protein n=1 Tax=Angomonas desouzai TaxID=59800 RepID=T1YTB4_9TRYP|nr:ubiquinone biosynthesis protein [Angomonas desouzai]
MSTAAFRQSLTYRSMKQLFVLGAAFVGCSGISSYYYYKTQYLPEQERRRLRAIALTPKRRTKQYIAGTRDGSGLLEEELLHQRSVLFRCFFYIYVGYRGVLLFFYTVPLFWLWVLVKMHLCDKKVLHLRLRQVFSQMGPSYIKLGQWMATRPDFFSPELCSVLEQLFDNTKPHSWKHTEKVLRQIYPVVSVEEKEENKKEQPSSSSASSSTAVVTKKKENVAVGGKNALYFLSEIEKVPINSGSIAQIHRATLRDSIDGVPAGTELAIKVTHPFIREQVTADLLALTALITVGNAIIPGMKYLNLDASIREFSSLLRSQLNLLVECDNIQQFRYNFRDVKGILFPTPIPSLCSPDLLLETFEEGEPLQDLTCSADNIDLAQLGCHMFLKMLFQDNFVHSDLHPGNLLVRTNWSKEEDQMMKKKSIVNPKKDSINTDTTSPIASSRPCYPDGRRKLRRELVVLDAGLVTTLSSEERNNFISLFAAVACGDGELGADLMIDVCQRK